MIKKNKKKSRLKSILLDTHLLISDDELDEIAENEYIDHLSYAKKLVAYRLANELSIPFKMRLRIKGMIRINGLIDFLLDQSAGRYPVKLKLARSVYQAHRNTLNRGWEDGFVKTHLGLSEGRFNLPIERLQEVIGRIDEYLETDEKAYEFIPDSDFKTIKRVGLSYIYFLIGIEYDLWSDILIETDKRIDECFKPKSSRLAEFKSVLFSNQENSGKAWWKFWS